MESSVPFVVQLERIRPHLSDDQVELLLKLRPGTKVVRLQDQCVLEVEQVEAKSFQTGPNDLPVDRISVAMRGCGCNCSDAISFQRVRFEGAWQVTELDAPIPIPDGFVSVGSEEADFQWVRELVTLMPAALKR